jgi:hypothetical protein
MAAALPLPLRRVASGVGLAARPVRCRRHLAEGLHFVADVVDFRVTLQLSEN